MKFKQKFTEDDLGDAMKRKELILPVKNHR